MRETFNPMALLLPVTAVAAAVLYFVLGRTRRAGRIEAICGVLCSAYLVLVSLVPFLRFGLVLAVPAAVVFAVRAFGGWRVLPRGVKYALDVSVVLAGLAVPLVFAVAYFED